MKIDQTSPQYGNRRQPLRTWAATHVKKASHRGHCRGILTSAILASVLALPALAEALDRYASPHEVKEALLNDDRLNPFPQLSRPGPGVPTTRKPAKGVGPNVQVNDPAKTFPDGLLGRSETTVAASDDGEQIIVGWNDPDGFLRRPFSLPTDPFFLPGTPGLSGYGFSTDGGRNWTDGGVPPVVAGIVTRGDPWLDRGGSKANTFFFANLAVDEISGAGLGVSLHRGKFRGKKFEWNDVQTMNSANPNDFYDKESLTAAKDGGKGGGKDVYISVTNFREQCGVPAFGFGQIELWRSHDGGDTWQGPTVPGPEDPHSNATCGNYGHLLQGSQPAVGPKGEVYVVWASPFNYTELGGIEVTGSINLARSLDGGATFETPVTVAAINGQSFNAPVGFNRDIFVPGDFPRIAVASSGEHRGRIYVSFSSTVTPVTDHPPAVACPPDLPAGSNCYGQSVVSTQSYLAYSDDRGSTWSTPVPVAPPLPATGIKRFFPVVLVEAGGDVDVMYYESLEKPAPDNSVGWVWVDFSGFRVGTAHSFVDVYVAKSTDGGATFKAPLRVTTATSDWNATWTDFLPNFGDYIGATMAGNKLLTTWADGRNGTSDVFFSKVEADKK